MKKRDILFLLLLVAAVFVNSIWAEEKNEIWDPVTPGPFTILTAPICEKGKTSIQPLYFFNIARGIFDGTAEYFGLPSKDYIYQQLLQLYTQFGLTDRIEVGAQPEWQWNYAKVDAKTASANGIGDTILFARYCAIDETLWIPRITADLQVKLPTGKYQKSHDGMLYTDITGTGSTDYTYGFSFTKGVHPIRTVFHLDLLLTNVPSSVRIDGVKAQFSNTYIVNGALEWIFYKDFNILGELLWQTQGDMKLDGDRAPETGKSSLIFSTGIGYSQKDWQMLVGYQRTLAGTNVVANDTVAVTIMATF